jgi:hypothetical protein
MGVREEIKREVEEDKHYPSFRLFGSILGICVSALFSLSPSSVTLGKSFDLFFIQLQNGNDNSTSLTEL